MTTVPERRVPTGALVAATLGLFLVWSLTFLAFEVLLAPRSGPAPFDWLDLVVARYVPVFVIVAVWCFGARRRESLAIVRAHPRRLLLCGFLAVAAYNGFLYYGMQRRVAAPVASLLTTLSPLYLLVLGVAFLGERLTWRKGAGLALGMGGVVLIAASKSPTGDTTPLVVAITALAPLSWSLHSALTKPVTKTVSPVLWTFLVLLVGSVPFLVVPFVRGFDAFLRLTSTDVALVLYLSVLATVGGFAVWAWLLRHLPASTVGLTIFLNPPLTTTAKYVLARARPDAFTFAISPQEWVGGALSLVGVAIAVWRRTRPEPRPDAR